MSFIPSVNQTTPLTSSNSIENIGDTDALNKKTQKVAFPVIKLLGDTISYGVGCVRYVFESIASGTVACLSAVTNLFSSIIFGRKKEVLLDETNKPEEKPVEKKPVESTLLQEIEKDQLTAFKEMVTNLLKEIKEIDLEKKIGEFSFEETMKALFQKGETAYNFGKEVVAKAKEIKENLPKEIADMKAFLMKLQKMIGVDFFEEVQSVVETVKVPVESTDEVQAGALSKDEDAVVTTVLSGAPVVTPTDVQAGVLSKDEDAVVTTVLSGAPVVTPTDVQAGVLSKDEDAVVTTVLSEVPVKTPTDVQPKELPEEIVEVQLVVETVEVPLETRTEVQAGELSKDEDAVVTTVLQAVLEENTTSEPTNVKKNWLGLLRGTKN